jgi:biotin operon repressor
MSFQAMAWAVKQTLPSRDKFVLIMLANYADESGKCWPSLNRLASDTSTSKSTVQNAIRALEAAGVLAVQARTQDGVSLPNIYHLKLEVVYREPVEGVPADTIPVYREPVGGVPGAGTKPINEPINQPVKRNYRSEAAVRFEEFWVCYPRKTARGAAEQAWEKACKSAEPDTIIQSVANASWPNDPQYIPHASTWLNQKRWLDEALPKPMSLIEQYARKALQESEQERNAGLLLFRS